MHEYTLLRGVGVLHPVEKHVSFKLGAVQVLDLPPACSTNEDFDSLQVTFYTVQCTCSHVEF